MKPVPSSVFRRGRQGTAIVLLGASPLRPCDGALKSDSERCWVPLNHALRCSVLKVPPADSNLAGTTISTPGKMRGKIAPRYAVNEDWRKIGEPA